MIIYFIKNFCPDNYDGNSQEIIDRLLSEDDEQDIVIGNLSAKTLRLAIQLWIDGGKLHFSGKTEKQMEKTDVKP